MLNQRIPERSPDSPTVLNRSSESSAWVVTDPAGLILDVSPSGAQMLSGSARGLQQRSLILFFQQDRDSWQAALTRASLGERVALSGRLRPKDRRPITVDVRIEREDTPRLAYLWSFVQEPADTHT